jgi:hypothetical protein
VRDQRVTLVTDHHDLGTLSGGQVDGVSHRVDAGEAGAIKPSALASNGHVARWRTPVSATTQTSPERLVT